MQQQQAELVEKFSAAVRVVFGEWTALALAVENEWGGHHTRERALALLQRVNDGLLASATVHRDELHDLLELAMMDDFNTDAEDESCDQVARILCTMHAEAKAGSTAMADELLQRAAGKSTWVQTAPPPRARKDDSSDDGCSSDGSDDEGSGAGGAMELDGADGARGRKEPEVDEDGFQMVQTRSRGRR